MKSLYIKLLFALFMGFSVFTSYGQNVTIDVDIDDLYYSEPGCGDCSGGPDPRWQTRINLSTGNFDWNPSQDDIGSCGWRNISNLSLMTPQLVAASSSITAQLGGNESDNFFCGGNDGDCGGLATVRTVTPITANDPCVWNFFTDFRNCTSDGTTSTYGIEWSYYYSYNFSPAQVSNSSLNNILCQGSTTPLSVTVNSLNGRSLGRWYKWQIATSPAGPFTDIPGTQNGSFNTSTVITYTPAQISGTRYYRMLSTSNCAADFGSNTLTSSVFTVTYAFISTGAYGGGDAAPAIQSPICGGTVSSGQTVPLSVLLPPTPGHVTNATYAWTSASGSLSSSSGSSVNWTAPATQGATTVSVTYNFGCPSPATVVCNTTVSDPACEYIYVSPSGTDNTACGGPATPCRTLTNTNGALAKVSGATNYIRMANGSYTEPGTIEMSSNLIIEGRYVQTGSVWTKSSNTSSTTSITCQGTQNISADVEHVMGVRSDNDNNWKLIDLNITTISATGQTSSGNGKSNYTIWINGSSGYEIVRCDITSGDATKGNDGISGSNGGNGSIGGEGGQPSTCSNGYSTSRGAGGSAGTGGVAGSGGGGAPNGTSGSNGGSGGQSGRASNCDGGSNGTAGLGPCGGGFGNGGGSSSGGNTGGAGANATCNGANGVNGTNASSTYSSGYFMPNSGSNGTSGSGGSGGGGGGGCGSSGTDEGGNGGQGGGGGGGGGPARALRGGRGGGAEPPGGQNGLQAQVLMQALRPAPPQAASQAQLSAWFDPLYIPRSLVFVPLHTVTRVPCACDVRALLPQPRNFTLPHCVPAL